VRRLLGGTRGRSGRITGTGVGRPARGTDRPRSGAAASLSGDVRPGNVDQLVRPVQRPGVEEHAHGFLAAAVGPDRDPARWRAAQLEPEVADRLQRIGHDAASRTALHAIASDDDASCREEHRGADPAQHDEQGFLESEVRYRVVVRIRALGPGRRGGCRPIAGAVCWPRAGSTRPIRQASVLPLERRGRRSAVTRERLQNT
jgi:hypothetical protein